MLIIVGVVGLSSGEGECLKTTPHPTNCGNCGCFPNPMNELARTRILTALGFCVTLGLLLVVSFHRVHTVVASLGGTCKAFSSLPPTACPAPLITPPFHDRIRLSLYLVEGDPSVTLSSRDGTWPAELTTGLSALVARTTTSEGLLDVSIDPPTRLAYGVLCDPGLLIPMGGVENNSHGFMIPSWTIPAMPGLINDWPVPVGASNTRTVYPMSLTNGSSALHTFFESTPVLLAQQSACGCGANSGGSGNGRGWYLDRSLWAALSLGSPTTPPQPCAPENIVPCGTQCCCRTLTGAQHLNIILYRAPPPISPLVFQAEGRESTTTTTFSSLHSKGLGWVLILNASEAAAPSHSNHTDIISPSEVVSALDVVGRALNWSLGVLPPSPTSPSHPASPAISHGCVLERETRRVVAWYCSEHEKSEGAGGVLTGWWVQWVGGGMEGAVRGIPPHVASQLQAAVQGLQVWGASITPPNLPQSHHSLAHIRLAWLHAQAAASDTGASQEGYIKPLHLLAVYASFWAPILPPLLTSILTPLLTFRRRPFPIK